MDILVFFFALLRLTLEEYAGEETKKTKISEIHDKLSIPSRFFCRLIFGRFSDTPSHAWPSRKKSSSPCPRVLQSISFGRARGSRGEVREQVLPGPC